MANTFASYVTQDGMRTVVTRTVCTLDTSDLAPTTILSLNMVSTNWPFSPLIGFGVDRINFDGTPGLVTSIAINAASPFLVAAMDTRAKFKFAHSVYGLTNSPGYDGSVIISTQGFVPGKVYGFTLETYYIKRYTKD